MHSYKKTQDKKDRTGQTQLQRGMNVPQRDTKLQKETKN